MGSQYEGRQDEIKDLKLPKIETFENEYPDRDYDVTIVTGKGELSSVCPKTGLPDFATLTVTYQPNETCIELKSFKEYMNAYRVIGIFHEFLANKILEDLVSEVDPKQMSVIIDMNPRGNITTKVRVDYYPGYFNSEINQALDLTV